MFNKLYLPEYATGIVIKLSGGADSSILYYGLCKYLTDNNLDIPIYAITMDTNRKPWYSHYAKKVIKFTNSKFGISPVEHRITFLDGNWTTNDYDLTQHNLMMSIINDNLANIAYSGLTQNPTSKDLYKTRKHKDYNQKGLRYIDDMIFATDKSRNDHSTQKLIAENDDCTMIRPFIRETKKVVAEWYNYYGVMDTLFPLTYSCEETDNEFKKFVKTENGFVELTHCGYCWFCMERIYGFDRLI